MNTSHYLALLARKHGLDLVIGELGGALWSDADAAYHASHAGRNETPVQREEYGKRMREKQLARVVQALVVAVINDSRGDAPSVQRFLWEGLGIMKPRLGEDDKGIRAMIAEDLGDLEMEVAELEERRVWVVIVERWRDGDSDEAISQQTAIGKARLVMNERKTLTTSSG